jgi:hypothetical protein
MRAVLSGHRRLGAALRILPPREHLLRLFRLVGLEEILPFDHRRELASLESTDTPAAVRRAEVS